MRKALRLARTADKKNEVPIGAILVKDGRVIASAYNLTKTKRDPTAHAEIVLIQKAAKILKNERFLGTRLYVTLEPCAMCAGAIVQARIPEVIFGGWDLRAGACGSVFRILPNKKLNHRPKVTGDVLGEESIEMLRSFFRRRRKGRLRSGSLK